MSDTLTQRISVKPLLQACRSWAVTVDQSLLTPFPQSGQDKCSLESAASQALQKVDGSSFSEAIPKNRGMKFGVLPVDFPAFLFVLNELTAAACDKVNEIWSNDKGWSA